MDKVPITLTGTPERIYALYKQFKTDGLTVQRLTDTKLTDTKLTDTKLTVYVTPMAKDEAVAFLVNNR